MKCTWQVQEAKNRFSEVLARATTAGAQTITRHGRPVAVVLSTEDYQKLKSPKSREKLVDILRRCPAPDLVIEKTRGPARKIDLG
jgi:prevent-host-death family protein